MDSVQNQRKREICCYFDAILERNESAKKFDKRSSVSTFNRFLCFVLIKVKDEKVFSYKQRVENTTKT